MSSYQGFAYGDRQYQPSNINIHSEKTHFLKGPFDKQGQIGGPLASINKAAGSLLVRCDGPSRRNFHWLEPEVRRHLLKCEAKKKAQERRVSASDRSGREKREGRKPTNQADGFLVVSLHHPEKVAVSRNWNSDGLFSCGFPSQKELRHFEKPPSEPKSKPG